MSAYERAFQPNEFERFLFLILEQGNTLAILIEEYARASGVAYSMLKNKIYSLLSNLQPLHQAFVRYLSETRSSSLIHYFDSLFDVLDDPKRLVQAHRIYIKHVESISWGQV